MKNAPYVECMRDGTGDDLTYYFLSKLVVAAAKPQFSQ